MLASAPSKRLLDLGCGTGEHARFLDAEGWEVVGIDRSATQLRVAREARAAAGTGGPRFVEGDLRQLDCLVDGRFGGAICLGNTLPHLEARADLDHLFAALRRLLAPAAALLIQILNYRRIFDQGIRYLPLDLRADEARGGEIVFLRLMEPLGDGRVRFSPTTLHYDGGRERPLEVVASRSVIVRGWTAQELDEALAVSGFAARELLGSMDGAAFDVATSRDLIVIAR